MALSLIPPKNPAVSRVDVLVASFSPFTRDLRHATAKVPSEWKKHRFSWYEPKFKDVKPKDRIKWWNIVPGDQVRVRGDPEGRMHQVSSINKFSNRVYLRAQNVRRDIHSYSNVQNMVV